MRVINTTTLGFKDEVDPRQCEYAILSHRWQDDEVSYQDYLEKKKRDGAGYAKIVRFCRMAKRDGFNWAWIDTCCIDKKSSAELSEAINSMFDWYSRSGKCYVYLADVPVGSATTAAGREAAFRRSQWWQRGWTLQELLAPPTLEFYDCEWTRLGSKGDLLDVIVEITGIKQQYLRKFLPYDHFGKGFFEVSIATIMSWMSHRSTLKSEDVAYCLMGLFNVNMPLLYGEGGHKAFVRLQLEIIKKSDDQTMFAWRGSGVGLLAQLPSNFGTATNVQRIWLDNPIFDPQTFSITNRGLKIRAPMAEADGGRRFMLLQCCDGECDNCSSPWRQDTSDKMAYNHRWLAVELQRLSNGQWTRFSPDLFPVDPRRFKLDAKPIYVVQESL